MNTSSWEVRLLGPMRAWRGGSEADLGTPAQQSILAALLLRGGVHASVEELAAGLWGPHRPPSQVGMIRTYVSRLRRSVAPAGREHIIRSVARGYAVQAGSVIVDVARFRHLVDRAAAAKRAERLDDAAADLGDALSLWNGTALAGLPGPYLEGQRQRLSQLRWAAAEERIAIDIARGHHSEAIADLAVLAAEDPYRERLCELRMRALWRAGRRADALATYHETRVLLATDLGIDPSPDLRELHRAILRGTSDAGRWADHAARSAGSGPMGAQFSASAARAATAAAAA